MMNEKELPVYAALDRMGIEYTRIEHPAAATMEACAAIGEGTGASHCKNLFLTNRQGTAFFLVMLGSSKKFRTASVSKQLGVARLSFTTAEQLENILGLTQGSVTVTGLLNDTTHCVRVAIDRDLLNEERILIHPNINTASLVVKTSDILRFLVLRRLPCGRPARTVLSCLFFLPILYYAYLQASCFIVLPEPSFGTAILMGAWCGTVLIAAPPRLCGCSLPHAFWQEKVHAARGRGRMPDFLPVFFLCPGSLRPAGRLIRALSAGGFRESSRRV